MQENRGKSGGGLPVGLPARGKHNFHESAVGIIVPAWVVTQSLRSFVTYPRHYPHFPD